MYKLLIVDDEKMIRQGIEKGIPWDQLGIEEVYTASSARNALKIIERNHPQIMLTDISMEEMTGLDLISQIRSSPSGTEMRILVFSGYSQFDYARQCLQMQVQNFLLKPIDEQELVENVRQQITALEEARLSREADMKKNWTESIRLQLSLEQFMRGLIHQKYRKRADIPWPEELLESRDQTVKAAILTLSAYTGAEGMSEHHLQQLTIKNICMDLVDFQKAGITFPDNDGRIIIAFFDPDEGNHAADRADELSKVLENECDVKARFLLGSSVERLELLYVSYHDALHLLEQEAKKPHTSARSSREEGKDKIIQDVCWEFRQAMIADIADTGKMMHIYERFSQAALAYNLSRKQIQRQCFDLAAGLYMSYVTETGEKPDNRIETLLSVLTGATRDDALEVTRLFISNLASDEEKSQHEIVTKAMRYIDGHLDAEISVAGLAEMFYVSPNYFSRLFKRISGGGCNEYIVKKRMEKAKILLETTTIKTGKIAMMVGYHDTNYFSLAFKKHIGKPPTLYREEAQRGIE